AGERDVLAIDDAVPRRDIVDMPPDAPAFFRLPHHAAERLCHQLVAEADSDHRNPARMSLAYKVLQRRDPVELIIDARWRARDQDRLQGRQLRKRLACDDADDAEID